MRLCARGCLCPLSAGRLSSASLPSLFCSLNTICSAPWSVMSFWPSSSSLRSPHSVLEGSARRASPLGASRSLLPLLSPSPRGVYRDRPAGVDGTVLGVCDSPRAWHSARESYLFVGLSIQFISVQFNSMPFNLIRVSIMEEPGGAA